ncbi:MULTISPECIES: nucleotidyltransferase domain-containing protein [unclassified Cytobacillus]|uniref:nucleotidyltransferase domain-containing protein n=1 Tax=unclassified Cytobacillus TaxID=2675268 RepID=UPI00203C4C2F|nr:nucleotidyltransferase domain-containing protein [Cytobacillus sp. AMY 15.2]MCM3091237.1 nucleotidyltransferase domain-containing protein [Cytobacillus sp. AMY 15.2]
MDKWLSAAEEKYNIDILFACEAGSRAWGTDEADSDYDIRFIFKHRNLKAYLSLERTIEVINTDAPYDAHGWDVFKAFDLMQKSNPSLFEWAYSPIIYKDMKGFSERLKSFAEEEYSRFKLFQHYIQLFSRNLGEAMKKDDFTLKKQKLLIQAVRACLISKQLLKQTNVKGDFLYTGLFSLKEEDDFTRFYRTLVHAKQSGRVIQKLLAKQMAEKLVSERDLLYAAADSIPKGKSRVSGLNEWLWELLNV